MAVGLKERSFGTLLLVVIVGILIGSYLSSLAALVPGGSNVVKTFFTTNFIDAKLGFPNALVLDLSAFKLQMGIQIKFCLLSVIGVLVSLYFFRWYK